MTPSLSVVVPMLNEADNVGQMVQEVDSALVGKNYELIIVDDGSNDGTGDRVRALFDQYPSLRLLRHERPHGQSTAIWNGAHAAQGEWIVVLDGDLQNDPADIARLLEARAKASAESGAPPVGMLIGHRVTRRDTLIRRISSRVANGVRRALLHDATPDTGCGLKLVMRSVFVELPYFDHMHRFMPALVQQLGYRVLSVPVGHRPRQAGRSKYGVLNRLWVGIVDLFGVAWLARRNRRTIWTEELPREPRREHTS
jgi:dolichol-phosphate mannosyltransferase